MYPSSEATRASARQSRQKSLEPSRAHFPIPHRVLDVLGTEVGLRIPFREATGRRRAQAVW
jgi:hypothetical protein